MTLSINRQYFLTALNSFVLSLSGKIVYEYLSSYMTGNFVSKGCSKFDPLFDPFFMPVCECLFLTRDGSFKGVDLTFLSCCSTASLCKK